MTRPTEPGAEALGGSPTPAQDDPLLRELGAWARDRAAAERERLDERWDRLAAGSLSPEDEAAVRAEAAGSAEGAAAFAAFQPLGAEAEARIVARISAQRTAERAAVAAASVAVAPPAPEGKVLPFRRRVALWSGGLGLAAAAVLVAVLVLPGRSGPLPAYSAEVQGGDLSDRGTAGAEAPGIPTFSPGSRFELLLRPAEAVQGNIAVRCLLVAAGGGPPRPFPACDDAKRSGDGSLRVVGTVGSEVQVPAGDWTIWAIVARPGELPEDPPVTGAAEAIVGKGWIGIPTSIRFAAAV